MTAEEIDRELDELGIDPEPIVERVTLFVRNHVADWRNRGLLHPGVKLLKHLFHSLTDWWTCAPSRLPRAQELWSSI